MSSLLSYIEQAISKAEKLLAVLIDPDKMQVENVQGFMQKVNASTVNLVLVGGSTVEEHLTDRLVSEIKKYTHLPIVIFPGDVTQITDKADAILFLSLISGRNPEYLIGKHIEAVSKLESTQLEVIPTGYILIENGKQTSVESVSQTKPMSRSDIQKIVNTAKAGELLGMKLMYLEAGSGALHPVSEDIITRVKATLNVPLIVGGGIRNLETLETAFNSGADMVVIGTAFENNQKFFEELKKKTFVTSSAPCLPAGRVERSQ